MKKRPHKPLKARIASGMRNSITNIKQKQTFFTRTRLKI